MAATGQRAVRMEETRAKLIKAARKAFAAKGYAAASMDELTAEAGLTRGALYHNFGDKKGLLRAGIDQIHAEMLARLRVLAMAQPDRLPPHDDGDDPGARRGGCSTGRR